MRMLESDPESFTLFVTVAQPDLKIEFMKLCRSSTMTETLISEELPTRSWPPTKEQESGTFYEILEKKDGQ